MTLPDITILPVWWFALLWSVVGVFGLVTITAVRSYRYPARHGFHRAGTRHARRIAWGLR